MDVRHGVPKLLGKISARYGRTGTFLPAVLCAFSRKLPQHHIGVIHEILVDGEALGALAEMHPFRFGFDGSVALLQKQNVRDHLCSRVLQEGVVRQTHRAKQFSPLCDVLPNSGVLLVHCAA